MSLKGKTIGVTGASGFLGGYLSRELMKQGAVVRAIVRNPQKALGLSAAGAEIAVADLADKAALTKAFTGCDAVISNAALYSVTNMNWDDNYQANKQGTDNVYQALNDAGVKRVVQISTFAVYKFSIHEPLSETSAQLNGMNKEGGAYRATKQISEQLAWDYAEKYKLDLTTIRPSAVYGAYDKNIMPYFKWLMKLPVLPVPTFSFPIVYAGDIAQAVANCLQTDKSIGQSYNTTGESERFLDLFAAWKETTGSGPFLIPLPLPIGVTADPGKAERDLGFRNRSFGDALDEIQQLNPADLS